MLSNIPYISLIFLLLFVSSSIWAATDSNEKIIVKDDPYLEDLINNLNLLTNSTKPPIEINSRMSEPPSQLRVGSINDSKHFARFAGAAYCSDSTLKAWNCVHCKNIKGKIELKKVYFDKATESRAFLALDYSRKEVVLSFRGSSTLKNFIQDAKFKKDQMTFKGGKYWVHRGFKQCAEALFPKYKDDLEKLMMKNKGFKLVVTGHSLGGAISAISVLMIRDNFWFKDDQISAFTYGEPRVGDQEFTRFVNRQSFGLTRVVNGNDLVPHLPPQIKFVSNFYHHQHEIWHHDGQDTICNDEYLEDPKCSLSKWYKTSVNDHLKVWGIKLGGKC